MYDTLDLANLQDRLAVAKRISNGSEEFEQEIECLKVEIAKEEEWLMDGTYFL